MVNRKSYTHYPQATSSAARKTDSNKQIKLSPRDRIRLPSTQGWWHSVSSMGEGGGFLRKVRLKWRPEVFQPEETANHVDPHTLKLTPRVP